MMRTFPWSQRLGLTIATPDGMHHWLWNIADMVGTRQEFLQRVLEEESFLNRFESGFFEAWDAFVRAEQEYALHQSRTNISMRAEALYHLCDIESQVGLYGYVNDVFLTSGGADWLLEWFDRELPKDVPDREQVIADLAVPLQTSFVQQQQIDLMKIVLQPESEWPRLLQQHAHNWAWVENSYIESEPITVEQFEQRVRALQESGEVTAQHIQQFEMAPEAKAARKKDLYAQFHLSQDLQKIIDCSDRISHMTDMRKQGVLRMNALLWPFFHDLSKETGIPFHTVLWMMPQELRQMMRDRSWHILEERAHSGAVTLLNAGELSVIQGDECIALDLAPFLEEKKDASFLKGQVAFKGVVTAPARIIRGRNDFHLFKKGDILITSQTTPEFIPLMKQAAAVVTEQGGITCHAAIVSRELKIPCMIGCTSAMTFFHDGAPIVMDGEKGEVRYA